MSTGRHTGGAAVHERLAPAGLTRLLGRHGARRSALVVAATALFVGACLVLVLVPAPPVTAGLIFVVPVAIIASELGTRAGLLVAGLSVATVIAWLGTGLGPEGPAAELPRALALLFLAWIIGRTSDRAARNRALIEQVLEATTDSIYVKDLDGRYLVANSAAGRLLGRPAEDIVGRVNAELVPEVAGAVAQHDAEVLETMTPATYEITGSFGSRRRVLSVTKSPFRDASGTVLGSLGIARDVSEERRTQERFRLAFEEAPIGMAMCDLDGSFLDVNRALCAITGHRREELCGRTSATFTHPDDVEADYGVMRALIEGTIDSSTDEKRYVRPDGSSVSVARSVTLVRDSDGTPLHFLSQIQDITDRRDLEEQLRRLADRDPLTGLYNRRRFDRELDRHLADVARYGERGALLVVDVDRFKRINDTLGHPAGDAVLVRVASALRDRLRAGDVVARLGGDEFAVLLPFAGLAQAEAVAADLVRGLDRDPDGREDADRVTASVGLAPFSSAWPTGEQMLLAADAAMYAAKRAGGDGFATARPDTAAARGLTQRVG